MGRFGMWFRNFMMGRYGSDDLNRFILIVTLILIVAGIFIPWRILDLLIVALLIYAYCRMFSRNINARYRENQMFLQKTARFRNRTPKASGQGYGGYNANGYGSGYNAGYGAGGYSTGAANAAPVYKVFRCPACGEKMKVPKGAGKIRVKCPHCQTQFEKKVR